MLHCLVKKENGVIVLSAVVLDTVTTRNSQLFWFDNIVTINAHYQKAHNILWWIAWFSTCLSYPDSDNRTDDTEMHLSFA